MYRKLSIIGFFFATMISSCSKGPVSLGGIKPNLESKIVVFADTFMLHDILDLSGNELSQSGDSIFLVQNILDTSYTGRELLNFADSVFGLDSMKSINESDISLRLDSFSDSKFLNQINVISRYDPTNFGILSGYDNDTVTNYSGFNNVTPTNLIVTPFQVPNIDSTSTLDTVRLVTSVENHLNFEMNGHYRLVTGGQVLFSKYIDLPPGDSFTLDTIMYDKLLGKKIKLYFDTVTCPGFGTPVYWSNSNQLKFNISLSKAYVSNGIIEPVNERVFLGSSELNVPIENRGSAYDLYVCSGQLDAQYLLNGIDGPFYLIRVLTDSAGYFYSDSTLMVQSSSAFVRNIMFQGDSLHISMDQKIYAHYYIRPLTGFPIRLKSGYSVDASYGAQSKWDVCFYRGPAQNLLSLSDFIDNTTKTEYSHLIDSLNLTNSEIIVNINGNGIGYLSIADSSFIKYQAGKASYADTIAWNMGSQLSQLVTQNQIIRNRPLQAIDSSAMGALPTTLYSEVEITADTTLGMKLEEVHTVAAGMKRLLGYCEGQLKFVANTDLKINTNGLLDSLILTSDSIMISFEGDAQAEFTTSSDFELLLEGANGKKLVEYAGVLNYNNDGWFTEEYLISQEHLSGQNLKLFISGSIQELEGSYIGMSDFLSMRVKLSFY